MSVESQMRSGGRAADRDTRGTSPLRSPGEAEGRFLPGLEGLRGIAVLVVLLFHADVVGFGGGFLGVSTFFTLSGYLITRLLLLEQRETGRVALTNFWGRRFRRLMPAALIALGGIALLAPFFGDAEQISDLKGEGPAALFYFANWWLLSTERDYEGLLGSPSPVQHFWSLAIEEQFYLFYPVAFAGLFYLASSRRGPVVLTFLVASLASFTWMIWLGQSDVLTSRIYYGTDTRAAELLSGAILALCTIDRSAATPSSPGGRGSVDLLAILAASMTIGLWATAQVEAWWLYVWGFPLYTLCSVVIVYAATQPRGWLVAFLGVPPLRRLGRISYGVYLYHWPIFIWFPFDLPGWLQPAVQIGSTCLVAELSYWLIEEPIRRGRRILGWRRWFVPLAFAATVGGAFWILDPHQASSDATLASRLREIPPTQSGSPDPQIAATLRFGKEYWTGKPNTQTFSRRGRHLIRSNALGLRGPPIEPKVANERRILILGDSVAFGQGVAENDAFPYALDANLGKEVTVVNASIGGWSRRQQRIFVERHLDEIEPDIVLIVASENDLFEIASPEWPDSKPNFNGFMKLHLQGEDEPKIRRAFQLEREELQRILDLTRPRGIRLGLLLAPTVIRTDTPANQIVKEPYATWSASQDVPFVAILHWIPSTRRGGFFQDVFHFSAVGHDTIAKALAGWLRDLGWLRRSE